MAKTFGTFKVDKQGVAAVFRSGQMAQALAEVGEHLASAADTRAKAWAQDKDFKDKTKPAFSYVAKTLNFTNVGVVKPASSLGGIYQKQKHVLESFNH